jgi:hypothetical protein
MEPNRLMTELRFEQWLRDQDIDPATVPDLPKLREAYDQAQLTAEAIRQTSLNPGSTGGFGYAVAIQDGSDLRATLWVKRSSKICVVLQPRDRDWNPHVTYHVDGRYHSKSYNMKSPPQQRQRLDGFKGSENLGYFGGHGTAVPKCDPLRFTAVMTVEPGVLEGTRGGVLVDLVEPGVAPNPLHRQPYEVLQERIFTDCVPHLVMAVVVPAGAYDRANRY